MLKIDREDDLDSDEEGQMNSHQPTDSKIPTRAQRLQQQANVSIDLFSFSLF